jgi:hypothetical protein
VPSSTFPQRVASPTTFAMLRRAWATTGLFASFGSGAGTALIGSLEKGEKTCGSPFCASVDENSLNQLSACGGSTRETPSSTLELRTCLLSVGSDVPARADPMSHATSSIARTLTRAPPVASTARAGDQVMYCRSLLPRCVVNAWPTEAHTMTMTTAPTTPMVPGCAPSVRAFHSGGSTRIAARPPPRKPVTERIPTTNPCL